MKQWLAIRGGYDDSGEPPADAVSLFQQLGHPFDPMSYCHVRAILREVGVDPRRIISSGFTGAALRRTKQPVLVAVADYWNSHGRLV